MYHVYFLYSSDYDRYYVGVSSDVEDRLRKHNKGWSKSTKPYAPWKIVYLEPFKSKSEAYKREFFLKSHDGYLEKKRIIDSIRM